MPGMTALGGLDKSQAGARLRQAAWRWWLPINPATKFV